MRLNTANRCTVDTLLLSSLLPGCVSRRSAGAMRQNDNGSSVFIDRNVARQRTLNTEKQEIRNLTKFGYVASSIDASGLFVNSLDQQLDVRAGVAVRRFENWCLVKG